MEGFFVEGIIEEETCVWSFLQQTKLPIVLYGMGNGADKVLRIFDEKGIKCSGVMASDDFVRGQYYKGYLVKKLADIESEFGKFIIAVSFASQIKEVLNNIYAIAQKHVTVVPNVPVFGSELADDAFFKKNKEEILFVEGLLEDEESKQVYRNILCFYYTGRLDYLRNATSSKEEIFREKLKLLNNERYLDLGAYRGDTIDELLNYTNGKYENIIALEPDKKTFKKLVTATKNMENIQLENKGVWNTAGKKTFCQQAGRSSAFSHKGGEEAQVTTIDALLEGKPVTYIKMDVEGAEKQAIEGGEKTIKEFVPKLNIAAYHHFEDIFKLAIQINKISPKYKFYLRHHMYVPAWDTNLYCVSKN